MKLIFTAQADKSLKEVLDFLTVEEVPLTKIITIRDIILAKAEMLVANPKLGQKEAYLDHLGMNHRRVIESHYKIIYRIENDNIYITDIFDSQSAGSK